MCAEAGFHADHTRWKLFEGLGQRQPFDLATQNNLAVSAEADDMKDFLADVDADRGQGRCSSLLLRCCGVVFADYPRGGSSRSIPLADIEIVGATARR